MNNLKIAIVGASIAGAAISIILERNGYDITVFEQAPKNNMVDRGAGIALPKDLVQKLITLDIFDKDFATINIDKRYFYAYDPVQDEESFITDKPFIASSVHWCSVYLNLVKRLPEEKVHYSTKVTAVIPGKKVRLTFNNREEQEFDIVIFADGFNSLGRKTIFPESALKYSNYIAWRGIERKRNDETSKRLKNVVPFYVYDRGHFLVYAIPELHTKQPEQEYIVNWLLYEKIDHIHPLYRDNKAQQNIPPTLMAAEYIEYLYNLAKKHLPPFPRDIVLQTPQPFTQAIYDAWVPQFFLNNVALMGDASILARPHVGAGSTKALIDALSLEKYLKDEPDIHIAMERWGKERQQVANKLFILCRALGDFLVSNVPNWQQMSKQTMDEIWEKIVKDHQDWYQIITN